MGNDMVLNDIDGMCMYPGCEGQDWHMDSNYAGCAVKVHLAPWLGQATQFLGYEGKLVCLIPKDQRANAARSAWEECVEWGGNNCDATHVVCGPRMDTRDHARDVVYFDPCHIHRAPADDTE